MEERTLPRFKDSDDDSDISVIIDKTYLLAMSGPHAGTVYTLHDGTTSLGRDPSSDIVLADTQVSRNHVQFINRESETEIIDLGSTNGTFLNGEKMSGQHPLEEGDEIQIGQSVFRFSLINPVDGGRLGLLTHGYFENRLTEELDRAHRYHRPLSLLMVGAGTTEDLQASQRDHLIRTLYPKIVSHIRKIIRNMDLLAHYGKFELELLLPETSKDEALRLAQRISTENIIDRKLFIFVGIATYPEDGRSRDLLFENARSALRQARLDPSQQVVKFKEQSQRVTMANQEVIVVNEKMKQLFELSERIAKSTITVLIQGETGVGKEVIAESIHSNSDRSGQAFVCINCAALTETLLESELFGHEKGSFTGAEATKIGLFETAKGGSIFLDEVGEMPLKTQAKLLRVLQAKKIMRVGSNKEIDTDVRVVAATNRKLEDLVAKKQFREDLFYRLNAATLTIPPLRERLEEIPQLVHSFIERFCKENDFQSKHMTADAMELLRRYHWPGNIRELKNAVERAVIISETDTIGVDSLAGKINTTLLAFAPGPALGSGQDLPTQVETEVGDMKEVVGIYEKKIILNALERTGWNQTKASELLNVPRRTLVSKIKKYKIKHS